jgi:hypothetical protein
MRIVFAMGSMRSPLDQPACLALCTVRRWSQPPPRPRQDGLMKAIDMLVDPKDALLIGGWCP